MTLKMKGLIEHIEYLLCAQLGDLSIIPFQAEYSCEPFNKHVCEKHGKEV